jgi:hypothetical protein
VRHRLAERPSALTAATDYCDGGEVGVVSPSAGVRRVSSVVAPDVVVVPGVIMLSGVMVVPDVVMPELVVPDVVVPEDLGPTGPVISG